MNRFQNHDGAFSMPTLPEDRLPPQNLDAERGVIGAALLDNASLHETALIVKPGDFYRDSHGIIWRAVLDLYDEGLPVDALLLIAKLTREGEYGRVGGDEAIKEILDSTPHAANAAYHAQIVSQHAMIRGLIESSNQTLADAYSKRFTADELVESAESRVFAIRDGKISMDTRQAGDFATEAMDRIEKKQDGEYFGIGTGWPELDGITGGFDPTDLVIVAGRPSMGKSALAMNMAEHAAYEGGYHSLFVSLEMGGAQLGNRLLMSQAKIDGHIFQTGRKLTPEQQQRLSQAYGRIRSNQHLQIDVAPTRTVSQIGANARRHKSRCGLDMLVIDYLQLIVAANEHVRGSSRQEQVAEQTRRLKALARELKIPVILLSQLNRAAEAREDHRPRMADLRESGAIEQDADKVILVHRPDYYDPNDQPGVAEVIVAKNRNGQTGTAKLVYLKQYTRFEAMAPVLYAAGDEPF